MYEKYESQMKKGALDMLVLKLLLDEPKYGYQLINELKEKSSGVFVLKEGTLYPILYRLEDELFIESAWSEAKGKQMARKYYKMTEAGRAALPQIAGIWKEIWAGIAQIMEEDLS